MPFEQLSVDVLNIQIGQRLGHSVVYGNTTLSKQQTNLKGKAISVTGLDRPLEGYRRFRLPDFMTISK